MSAEPSINLYPKKFRDVAETYPDRMTFRDMIAATGRHLSTFRWLNSATGRREAAHTGAPEFPQMSPAHGRDPITTDRDTFFVYAARTQLLDAASGEPIDRRSAGRTADNPRMSCRRRMAA